MARRCFSERTSGPVAQQQLCGPLYVDHHAVAIYATRLHRHGLVEAAVHGFSQALGLGNTITR